MTTNPTAPSAEAISAGVLALAPYFPPDTVIAPDAVEEGEYVLAPLEQIVAAIITAALPLLSVPEEGEVAFLHERVETALIERAEFEAEAGRLREALRCGATDHPTAKGVGPCHLDKGHDGEHVSTSGCAGSELRWPSRVYAALIQRDEAVAQVERVRALADEWESSPADCGSCSQRTAHATQVRARLGCDCHRHEMQVCDICQGVTGNERDRPAARTPDDDAEGKS